MVPPPVVPGLTGLSVLARGGYATVYRAVQESIGRDVAVKIENRSLGSEHDRRRFMREARAAGRMSSHPHVVDLFDAGHSADGHPYLIMELCDGSYAERLRAAPLRPAEVRDVGAKIADALADAHRLGVLHRDVKPANILVTGFGEPALADFGLAVLTEQRDLSITMDVLTPAYAPREMFRPGCQPSPAADVYALCATLYALLRGKPPRWYEERDPTLFELLELFDVPIPDLPGVPAELLDLLRRGMSNEITDRPGADELRDRLIALGIAPAPIPAGDAVRVTPQPASQPQAWSMLTQPRPDDLTSDLSAVPPVVSPVVPPAAPPASTLPAQAALAKNEPAEDAAAPAEDAPPENAAAPAEDEPPENAAAPAERAVEAPADVTVPNRRGWWPFLGAGVAVLVLGLLTAGIWYSRGQAGNQRTVQAGVPRRAATASAQPWGGIGDCMLGAVGAACPTSPQCFDSLSLSSGVARARSLPCTKPHTWEVFAIGLLAADTTAVAYPAVKTDQEVARICNPAILMLVDINAHTWEVDVLPPSPEALARGDRTFRCLAGTGLNRQSTATFVR